VIIEREALKLVYYTILMYRKTPLLVPGVGPFSNANIFVWDQYIKENKTDFKISTCLLLNPVLY
jgi:hypothetical protein